MYDAHHISDECQNGVVEFMRAAEADKLNKGQQHINCPCKDCENKHMFDNS